MPAVPDFQFPSWQPGIKDPMHALDIGLLAPAVRPTAASVENLLRRALATTTPDEICFVYFPPDEIRFSPETRERTDERTSLMIFLAGNRNGLCRNNLLNDQGEISVYHTTRPARGILSTARFRLDNQHCALRGAKHRLSSSPKRSLPHETGPSRCHCNLHA